MQTLTELLTRAQKLVEEGALDAAINCLQHALSIDSGNIKVLFYLGCLYLLKNDLMLAEATFKELLAIEPSQVQALNNLGVIALRRAHAQLAIHYFGQALAFDNNNLEARNNLAATFMHHDRYENALTHYELLLEREPQNIEYLYNAGVAQMTLGHLEAAIKSFNQVLQQQPQHFASLTNLAAIYNRLNQKERAIIFLESALKINPAAQSIQFMLHALKQDTIDIAPNEEYIKNLFDNYALYYDSHMQKHLNYRLDQHLGLQLANKTLLPKALDLGCGTGLCGQILRPKVIELTGVDISAKMLQQARNKNIYDHLIHNNILNYLRDNQTHFNLIIALEVLSYLGNLDELFVLITDHLTKNGEFFFTIEPTDEEKFHLETTARFSHNPAYIEELCKMHNLQLDKKEKVLARRHDDTDLYEIFYIVRKIN